MFLSILVCSLTFIIHAQEKITLKTEVMSDFYPQSMFKSKVKGYLFKVGDGDFQTVGFKGKNIEAVLKNNEAAYKEFLKFKRKINIGKVSYFVGVGALVSSPFWFSETDTDEQIKNKTIGVLVTSVVSLGLTIYLGNTCIKHLENAVVIYNSSLGS